MTIHANHFDAVIFDGDDTLWFTEHLYDDARNAAKDVVERAGFDGDRWEEIQRERDVENVAIFGHSSHRFPTSCRQALELLSEEVGDDAVFSLREQVYTTAQRVFDAPAPNSEHALPLLKWLKGEHTRTALLTKGDVKVQLKRIRESGFESYFDVIEIVEAKDVHKFFDVVMKLRVSDRNVLTIGNSMRSDIEPAVAAGLESVWVPAYVWEYEHYDGAAPEGVHVVENLSQCRGIIEERNNAAIARLLG